MLALRSLSRSPVVSSFVFKKVLHWNRTLTCKTLGNAHQEEHSWRAEQLANRMNALPQDYWELVRELESTSTGRKIFFTSFTLDPIYFRQLKQKL